MTDTTMPGNPHIRNAEYIDRAPEIRLIDATLALAFEQRTANLIACSQKVYIPGSPDAIRERLGDNARGVEAPTPFPEKWKQVIVAALHEALSPHCYTKPYDDADTPGDLAEYGVDGMLDLNEVAGRIYAALENTDAG